MAAYARALITITAYCLAFITPALADVTMDAKTRASINASQVMYCYELDLMRGDAGRAEQPRLKILSEQLYQRWMQLMSEDAGKWHDYAFTSAAQWADDWFQTI